MNVPVFSKTGYDKLQESLPVMEVSGELTESQKARRTIRHTLASVGFNEAVTYSLISPSRLDEFLINEDKNVESIKLSHPMSEEHSVLRKSLLSSLVDVVSYHNARKLNDTALFEIGKKYYRVEDTTYGENLFAGIITGKAPSTLWQEPNKKVDFYYVKGVLDLLFNKLRLNAKYLPLEDAPKELHPKRVAKIIVDDKLVGFVGALHPKYTKDNNLEDTYVFELNLDQMLEEQKPVISFKHISKVPSVDRDLALVMDINQNIGEILDAIKKSDKMISNVKVFDLYIGDKIDAFKKSVAIRITLESDETLTEEVISSKINRILKSLEYRFKITLRA